MQLKSRLCAKAFWLLCSPGSPLFPGCRGPWNSLQCWLFSIGQWPSCWARIPQPWILLEATSTIPCEASRRWCSEGNQLFIGILCFSREESFRNKKANSRIFYLKAKARIRSWISSSSSFPHLVALEMVGWKPNTLISDFYLFLISFLFLPFVGLIKVCRFN